MADHHTHPKLDRWLSAEARNDDRAADAALDSLLAGLSRTKAPAGFAARAMIRVAEPAPWPLERVALALLLVCGLALGAAPLWVGALWERYEPGALMAAGAGVLVHGAALLADLVPIGVTVTKVARWASLAGSSPQVLAFLAFCALLAATAGRLLVSLLDERSAGHAQV